VIRVRPAPIPLLALPCRAMSHNIRALTVGAVQYLENHEATLALEFRCLSYSYQE
jgi:hypothetical protein